jgi:hypothetical protein
VADPDEMDAVAIVDVTAELIGERRADYHAGRDDGLLEGTRRVLNSDALVQIAFELTVQRVVNDGMIQVAEQREKLLAHWKAEAQWWREEHDKVHAEYCEFAKAIERKFCR